MKPTMRSLRSRSMDTLPKLDARSVGTKGASSSDTQRACSTCMQHHLKMYNKLGTTIEAYNECLQLASTMEGA